LADIEYRKVFPRVHCENLEYNLRLINILKEMTTQKGTSAEVWHWPGLYQLGKDISNEKAF